jgi:hypothetical protein
MAKEYLGDSVYIKTHEEFPGIILTTENGYEATNTIFLEPEVIALLFQYLKAKTPYLET